MRTWIEEVEELSEGALTVRAQTVSPNDQGRLRWDVFFPRENVDSVDLDEVTVLDWRPTADRRDWNARGRYIPSRMPPKKGISMVPIESYDKISEYEMQKLMEGSLGNETIVRELIGVRVPDRVVRLSEADYRRLEVDSMRAWYDGKIIQRNPQNPDETYEVSFAFAAERLQVAGTAWNDPGQDAYANLIDWLEDAIDAVGPIEGVATRLSVIRAIQEDAPDLIGGVRMTRAQLEERISDDIGMPFRFFIMEDSVDIFSDGGLTTVSTKTWGAGHMAVVPSMGTVGRAAFAPVARAMELVRVLPKAGIDIRGVTVYYDERAMGRDTTFEAQLNAVPIPNEQKVFVIDTLIP